MIGHQPDATQLSLSPNTVRVKSWKYCNIDLVLVNLTNKDRLLN